jgi:glycosyltransferase involved in cell wall biosynthesis
MKQPKVTVITATYNLIKNNRKDYFIQALESVHNQSYENIEHLVIDGASDDGTIKLLQEYQDKGWITYYSEPDKGIYDAFNKGIDKASGKYIAFLNSDDFYNNKNAVKLSVNKLEKTNADFSFATAHIVREDGSIYYVFKPNTNWVWSRMPFCHQTMFTKTEVLKKEGKFNLEYKSASDYDFIIRLFLKNYKFCKVNANIATFRLGGESCENAKVSILEQMQIFKNLYKEFYDLSQNELENIVRFNDMPEILLRKLPAKNLLWHYKKFKIKKFTRKYISFKISLTKGIEYFSLLGKWYKKPKQNVDLSFEEYLDSINYD